jgi:predicted enzyme related to lactoylglutathione lyase
VPGSFLSLNRIEYLLLYSTKRFMKTRLGRMVMLVDDYDAAFTFYEKNFFCKKLFDASTAEGQRYLHVGFSEDDNTGIWFLKADSTAQINKIGKQTEGQPTLVVYTDNIEKLYAHVQNGNVQIVEALLVAADSKFFHCLDLYGNRITVVQLLG